MQAIVKTRHILIALSILLISASCHRPGSFEAAVAKHRGTLVDHVSDPGHGLPHYSIQTLNPTWDTSQPGKLVTIPSFKLVDQNGAAIDERIFDGKITIVGFMFTACQGFCPFVVEGMKNIERDFKTKAQFIALSVDPENDSVAQLKSYAKRHGLTSSSWHLLTGDKDTIYGLAKGTFASQAFKKPSKDPNFIHSEHLYVIGPDRRLRGVLNGTRIDVKRDARAVITELERTTTQM